MEEAQVPPPTSFEARMAGRTSIHFFLDIGDMGRQGAPVIDALLMAAVIEANVGRLNRDPALQAAHARLDSPPPDALRRPVSVNALAVSLDQPFETVRRHINQLIAAGLCVATPAGVYVPSEVLASEPFVGAARARYQRFWRFYEELRGFGVIEPMPYRPLPVEDPAAPVRAVGRVLSDYFFRTTDVLHRHVSDLLTGLILLAVVRANAEHLPPAQVVAILRTGWLRDEHRVPVRVAELSRRIGAPYETTRRHVGRLVEQGFCKRAGGGLLVDSEALHQPTLFAITSENFVNVRRMFRQAAALGAEGAGAARREGESAGAADA
ncbi:MAG: hypothetical protein JWQ97_3031 [Phenylobacterium sp.]|nr:hypothetical protein [Phenylobacterium sp.]